MVHTITVELAGGLCLFWNDDIQELGQAYKDEEAYWKQKSRDNPINDMLTREVTNEEIKQVVFDMHPLKGPGVDGIPACNDDRNIIMAQDDIVVFADASVHKEKKTASIGVVALDSYGNLLHAIGSPIQYVGKAITAEAIAIRMALENAREKGWTKVQILSDAKKCGGYGTTKKYSLVGDRDYL
ncbi:hypothetical protein KY290_016597 [Solanum tuberosum]|uniref:RNase H type-1 domain-containing protein n=1 Tax=Solanum tuberosum TaxID=4113 RepID=A0ABQ7VAH9_SOLTU|nr:hypothetical protein KY284_015873 [Solanum tuberosum]KAH0760524.1 hypothetical protein KY290_016597 [Solanum tuberosum]